jgi:iron complex transport system ATP-binding protein
MSKSGLLQVHGLSFSYPQQAVLRGVELALRAAEVVALIGPNGSGKSTLLKLLLGHLEGEGAIEWEGRYVHAWRRRELGRRVAYLPQTPTWDVEHRVIDVLRLGRAPYWSAFGIESEHDEAAVARAAVQLQLSALLNRRMDELSGGQRQRVFIGRCLAQEPVAMLLDEPNTYLDVAHQVELARVIHRLSREFNVAVLMASHDLNLAAVSADRLVLLSEGGVIADGSADEVLRPELLGQAYGVEMERIERGGGRAPIVVPVI